MAIISNINGKLTVSDQGQVSFNRIGTSTTTGYTFPALDGTANQILKTNGVGVLTFVDDENDEAVTKIIGGTNITVDPSDGLGDVTINADLAGTVTGTGAAGRVTFWTGAQAVSSTSGFTWDNGNNYLSINKWTASTATPAAMIHLFGKDNNINSPAIIIEGRDNLNDTRLKIAVRDPQVRFLLEEGNDAANGYGLMTFETTAAPNAAASERGGFDFDLPGGTAMTITNTANVGIGTNSPLQKFVVAAATNGKGVEIAPGTLSYIQAYDRGASVYSNLNIDALNIQFGTNNGTERMRIASNGYVGIGTNTSTSTIFNPLGVSAALSATDISSNYNPQILGIQNTNTTANNYSLIGFQDASANINVASMGALNEAHSSSPNSVIGSLVFRTKPSGSAYTKERVRINSAGNVGIGVPTPANLLSAYNTNSTLLNSKTPTGAAENGTGGGNRGFDGSFTNATRFSFTGTDSTDQGYGYFKWNVAGTETGIVSGKTYTIHFKHVATNGSLFQIITSSGTNFASNLVQNITKYPLPVSGELYSLTFTATAAAAYIGFGALRTSGTMSLAMSEVQFIEGKPDTETGSIVAYKNLIVNGFGTSEINNGRLKITSEGTFNPATGMLQVRNFRTGATGAFTNNYVAEIRGATTSGALRGALLVHQQESNDGRPTMEVSDAAGVFTTFVNQKVGIGITLPATKLDVYQGDIRRSGVVSGGYIELGSLPGYSANAFQSLTSGGTIHFSNNAKYCAYLEGANTVFGILNSSSVTKISLNTSGDSYFTGGDVVIGATSAGARLDVVMPNSGGVNRQDIFRLLQSGQNTLSCYMYGGATDLVQLHVSGSEQNLSLTTGGAATATTSKGIHIRNTTGFVGIDDISPSYQLDVAGTIRATGDVIAYSDERVKENIKTIDNSLEKVSKLRGVEFNKIGEDIKSIGVIAQEIEKVIPEVVREDDKGMKSVAYGNITGILIEAIKELKQEIEELKKQIK